MQKKFYLIFLLIANLNSFSQTCTELGQTPSTAFPVCGVNTFSQITVPYCNNQLIPTPCNDGVPYSDKNPYWYKFTCFSSGTLGFVITPDNLNDDYDWQVFDITNRSPDEVYTNSALFVACNWSGNSGATGASSRGTSLINCAGFAYPTFSSMPQVLEGHNYLLLVSHYTNAPNGYKLSFGGGTASITDPAIPQLVSAQASCDGSSVTLQLSKKTKCSSLSKDGSEFSISPANAKVATVTGIGCSNSFDVDSIVIRFDKDLTPGDYTLIIQDGSDGNTLLDNCENSIVTGSSVPFTIYAIQPTPMDSLTPVACAPDEVQLVFKNKLRCSSIAGDGSDFTVTGTSAINIASASGSCINGLSNIVHVKFSKPVQNAGSYSIILKEGDDGNTLIDECGQETPPGASLNFYTADTVSSAFNYHVGLGCVFDTIVYSHDRRNGVNEWNWTFDSDGVSTSPDSFFLFSTYGNKNIQLAVSNGVCTDTSSVKIVLDNELTAAFSIAPSLELCPEDAALFRDTSVGKITSWYWLFGDGTTSTDRNPPLKLYSPAPDRNGIVYPVSLIVKNDLNCFDTSTTLLKILYTCYIAVPTAFTPNGDGLNDYLYPVNAYKSDNLDFRVYNRLGRLIFETKDWTKKWDGSVNGSPQNSGVYVWMLNFTNRDTGKKYALKGTTVLIR